METLVERMVGTIASADSMVKQAFSGISADKMARLLKLFPGALDGFLMDDNFSDKDADLITASAKKVRMTDLLRGLSMLSDLFSDDFLNTIRRACSGARAVPLDPGKISRFKGTISVDSGNTGGPGADRR